MKTEPTYVVGGSLWTEFLLTKLEDEIGAEDINVFGESANADGTAKAAAPLEIDFEAEADRLS